MAKAAPARSRNAALALVRRLMASTGFDEEGQADDRIIFGSREGGDMEEDRPDPELVRFALATATKIEAAVPGSSTRVEAVDEWVTIAITLPAVSPSKAQKLPKPSRPAKGPTPKAPAPSVAHPPTSPILQPRRSLRPGDNIDYTSFTVGGSSKKQAIVTWDHGKHVEARTLGGERLRLERASDGTLRRFT